MTRRLLIALATLTVIALPGYADEWERADAAFAGGEFDVAIALTTPLAEAGNVEAQNRLAHMYRYGEGTPMDSERAVLWTRAAADQGSRHAYFVLYAFYTSGRGVPKDAEVAHGWLLKAAAQGEPLAHYNLYGAAIRDRETADYEDRALSHLKEAAELGGSDGQYALGQAYFYGTLGLEKDVEQALKLVREAADQRHLEAMVFAGALLGLSYISQVDYLQSATYLRAALSEGCFGVGQQVSLLLKAMPLEDLLQSDSRLAEWLERHPPPEPHRHRAFPEVCLTPN